MTSRLLLILICLVTAGCSSRTVSYDGPPALARPAIVFVPGFYGTALADAKTGERYFLSAWKALFSSVPLALDQPDLGVAGARALRIDGVLETVPVIPGLYSVNAYGEALDFLHEEFGKRAEIVPFAYDWRKDLGEDVEKLDQLVRALHAGGAPSIFLVSHSMGGLLVALYLRDHPLAPVSAAVIAAAPFGGVATAFRNLQTGTSVGLAKEPLTAASLSTFPSMYYLISQPETLAYRDRSFHPIADSIYDPAPWKAHHWGLLRDPVPVAYRTAREQATAHYLQRAKAAAAHLRAPTAFTGKPLMVYIGTGQRTFARMQWTGASWKENGHWLFRDESVRQVAADASLFDDGDGTVPTVAATPPPGFLAGFRAQVVRAPATHSGMFGNEQFRNTLREFMKANGKALLR